MSRNCSQCGSNGHNARTCGEISPGGGASASSGAENGIMLFGVRVTAADGGGASFRKSMSMNNLSQYDHAQDSNVDVAAGYDSDDVVHASGRSRERKRGVPWTEEEHKLFLMGLQRVGKGDWRGISRNFVKTRTPTQVASHAQKYFLRRNNLNRRRRRSSLFDITPDSFNMGSEMDEDYQLMQDASPISPQKPPRSSSSNQIPPADDPLERLMLGPSPSKLLRPLPLIPLPPSSKMATLNLNNDSLPDSPLRLTLKLSTTNASTSDESPGFQGMAGGDSIISVA